MLPDNVNAHQHLPGGGGCAWYIVDVCSIQWVISIEFSVFMLSVLGTSVSNCSVLLTISTCQGVGGGHGTLVKCVSVVVYLEFGVSMSSVLGNTGLFRTHHMSTPPSHMRDCPSKEG